MRLSYSIFETPIIFMENKVNILIIENQNAFSKFIISLVKACEGEENSIVLSKHFEEVKLGKVADVVTDIVSLDSNNKKILTKMYNKLNEIAFQESNYTMTLDIISKINKYLFALTQDLPCSISFDDNIELAMLFKSVSLRIYNESKNILEKLCDYIEIMNEFCQTELFVFVNLKSFLSSKELEEFYKFIKYKKVKILIIENILREKLENEIVKIIDNDLCDIS